MKRWLWLAQSTLLAVAACSSNPVGSTGSPTDTTTVADGGDAAAGTDDGAAGSDSAGSDVVVATDVAPDLAPDIDYDLLDPEEDTSAETDTSEPAGPVGSLYAHSAEVLWRLDLGTGQFTEVGTFAFDKNEGSVTDLALDKTAKLYATTHDDLFECSTVDAACTWLAALPGTYFGLSFVPAGTIDPTNETLVGIEDDGTWSSITFANGKATIKSLGKYGNNWMSSGDMFSVEGIGTYATLKGKGSFDTLAKVNPKTGKIEQIIGGEAKTGVKSLFGLAWWQGVTYGFSSDGNVYDLDLTTGVATKISTIAVPPNTKWWGAGVSTRAAGKPAN